MPQKYSKAQYEANRRYNSKAYEQVAIYVRKGKKDVYKKLAEMRGQSMAGMIQELLDALALDAGLQIPEESVTETTEE